MVHLTLTFTLAYGTNAEPHCRAGLLLVLKEEKNESCGLQATVWELLYSGKIRSFPRSTLNSSKETRGAPEPPP